MGKNKVIGLFSFDGPLYKDKNGIYCSVTLTNEMFNRFFSVIDKLYIVVRIFQSNKTYIELNMKPLNLENMRVIEVSNLVSSKGLLLEKSRFEKYIKNIIKKSDLIFCRMPSITSNSVIKVAKSINKPYLVEVGGCAWDSYWNHGIKGKIVAPLMFYQEKKNVRDASFATYVTKQFLQNRYPTKGVSTNCSNVYLQSTERAILDERINKIKNRETKKIVIGTATNSIDVKYKGEHFVIRAMKDLKSYGYNIEYQIVGPGHGDFLKQQAIKYNLEDSVKLMGSLKKEEIFKWYKSIDIYVQPSKQEGLPRTVIEAMSVGCPCLGSNIAGIPELLDSDCLFDPNKNSEIVKAFNNLLNKEIMINNAMINFKRAQEYNLSDIESRRKQLFMKYKQSVVGKEV